MEAAAKAAVGWAVEVAGVVMAAGLVEAGKVDWAVEAAGVVMVAGLVAAGKVDWAVEAAEVVMAAGLVAAGKVDWAVEAAGVVMAAVAGCQAADLAAGSVVVVAPESWQDNTCRPALKTLDTSRWRSTSDSKPAALRPQSR